MSTLLLKDPGWKYLNYMAFSAWLSADCLHLVIMALAYRVPRKVNITWVGRYPYGCIPVYRYKYICMNVLPPLGNGTTTVHRVLSPGPARGLDRGTTPCLARQPRLIPNTQVPIPVSRDTGSRRIAIPGYYRSTRAFS